MVEQKAVSTPAVSSWRRVTGIVSAIAVALALLVFAFAWPASRAEASGLAIAVTGDGDLVSEFADGVEGGLGGVVELVMVADRDEAVSGIRTQDFIGGIVLTQAAPEVLTASAAGQVPAAFMTALASQLQTTLSAQVYAGVTEGLQGALAADPAAALAQLPDELPTVQVTDIVPFAEGDPNGVGITAAGIPMTVGALLAGVAIAFTVTGLWHRLTALLGLSIGGGLILTLLLSTWLDVYPGGFAVVWLVLALSVLATSGLIVGLHSALGRLGIGITAALTLFAAMPWAAFAVPYPFLPAGLGYIGQWLIPGATATLTRSVGYFPDAATTGPWWALWIWALIGVALLFVRRLETADPRNRQASIAS